MTLSVRVRIVYVYNHLIRRRAGSSAAKKRVFHADFFLALEHENLIRSRYNYTHKTSRERWRTTRKFTRLQQ